ncbi:hypothetical protein ACWCXC_22210 [Streptomyces sp. NPDC001515]
MGRPVTFSDDSLLTLLAKLRGRTVQQPTAYAHATMPQNLSHHIRQQVRWMRGSAIRSFWRIRYLPISGYAFWHQVCNWYITLTTAAALVWFLFLQPADRTDSLTIVLLIAIVLGYLRCLRYLTVRPGNERLRTRLLVVAFAPLMALWTLTVLRACAGTTS